MGLTLPSGSTNTFSNHTPVFVNMLERLQRKKNYISSDSVLSKFYGFCYAHTGDLEGSSEQVGFVPETGKVGLRQRL